MSRFSTVLVAVATFIASVAFAGAPVPDPAHCTFGPYISLEGASNGVPDNCSDGRCANYTVTIRDAANFPIAGSSVAIGFGGWRASRKDRVSTSAATGPSPISPPNGRRGREASLSSTLEQRGAVM